jgi:hypothetical protein
MAGVIQNIDPSPPGRTHSLGGEGGEGSIFWKTSDTALYSTYVSALWSIHSGTGNVRFNKKTISGPVYCSLERMSGWPIFVLL